MSDVCLVYVVACLFAELGNQGNIELLFSCLKTLYIASFRACLDLVSPKEQCVKEELDLITALSVLAEFNVTILPLQGTVEKM